MTVAFADTGFYVAAASRRDAHHHQAMAAIARTDLRVVTTEFVLIEVANIYCRAATRQVVLELIARMRSDTRTGIIPASASLFANGLVLFAARPDKDWSLTDCISSRS